LPFGAVPVEFARSLPVFGWKIQPVESSAAGKAAASATIRIVLRPLIGFSGSCSRI
jgi:hypothetical protein